MIFIYFIKMDRVYYIIKINKTHKMGTEYEPRKSGKINS